LPGNWLTIFVYIHTQRTQRTLCNTKFITNTVNSVPTTELNSHTHIAFLGFSPKTLSKPLRACKCHGHFEVPFSSKQHTHLCNVSFFTYVCNMQPECGGCKYTILLILLSISLINGEWLAVSIHSDMENNKPPHWDHHVLESQTLRSYSETCEQQPCEMRTSCEIRTARLVPNCDSQLSANCTVKRGHL
jgi:hypothetical protein